MTDKLQSILRDGDQRLEIAELRAALMEMVIAHSMANVGLGASKRRLEAIKKARATLAYRTMTAQTNNANSAGA